MKVFLGIIGVVCLVMSAAFGIDGFSQYSLATMTTHQSVALGLLNVSAISLLTACVCFSACIKTTKSDLEEFCKTVTKRFSELRQDLNK